MLLGKVILPHRLNHMVHNARKPGKIQTSIRPLVKSEVQENIFIISQPKHMLWVLNETALLSTLNIC